MYDKNPPENGGFVSNLTRADFCLRTGLISCYAILCDMPRINTFRPHLRLP